MDTNLTSDPTVLVAVTIVILCILIGAAIYLLSILRDYTAQDHDDSPALLSNLQEMHQQGDISEEEFRRIQSASVHQQDRNPPGDNPISE